MKLNSILQKVREHMPLIHCITNPISINQCANAILAVGGRPNMAEHPQEVGEITTTAQALMLNLGNITDVRMNSMMISAQVAKDNNIPVILDIVGVACSTLRRQFACEIIERHCPQVIKGNYSEIKALYDSTYKSAGVDAELSLSTDSISAISMQLAVNYNAIILATGSTDIITDGKTLVHIHNGTPQLARITGTGCILGALCSCCMSVSQSVDAIIAACTLLGICGELAETHMGSGSFMVNLMDRLSTVTDIEREAKIDEKV